MGNAISFNDNGGFNDTDAEGLGNGDDAIIYQSQCAMNLSGATDCGEYVTNAIKRIPKENRVTNIADLFKYKKKIGQGASGNVLLVQQKFGEETTCALKELPRKQTVNAHLFLREALVLKSLQHPNILELHDVYLDGSNYFIATAYYSGGDFLNRIYETGIFSEQQARPYIKSILKALRFMHGKGFVHRDLKPSNIVLDQKGKNGTLKLIDFGTSECVMDEELYAAQRVGTILYAPPEWKRDRSGAHIKKSDLWSLGVMVYVMMVGRLPFEGWKHIDRYNNDLWFPKKIKKKLSSPCFDFISKLLQRYPEKRLSAKQALKHRWITNAKKDASAVSLGADLKRELQSTHAAVFAKTEKMICEASDYGSLSIDDLVWF